MRVWLLIGLLAVGAYGQKANDADVWILTEALASENVCGNPDLNKRGTLSGTVAARRFDEDEMTLLGIVIKDAKDRRTYVNIDTEYLSNAGRTPLAEVADYLIVGRRIKLSIVNCRKIQYLAGITAIK